MEYRLGVLTHGRGSTLEQTLDSFERFVTPPPVQVVIHADGPFDARRDELRRESFRWRPRADVVCSARQVGFCRATGSLWSWVSQPGAPFVFWLEHDFVFRQPLDLRELAYVLEQDNTLAQMALMRGAVNEQEIAAGGLFESRPGEYHRGTVWFDRFAGDPAILETPHEMYPRTWHSHRSYFTTNPSLMRTEFMRANPWPDDDLPECEGRFGIELVRRGYQFGVWGDGSPWVDHVGLRTGIGY